MYVRNLNLWCMIFGKWGWNFKTFANFCQCLQMFIMPLQDGSLFLYFRRSPFIKNRGDVEAESHTLQLEHLNENKWFTFKLIWGDVLDILHSFIRFIWFLLMQIVCICLRFDVIQLKLFVKNKSEIIVVLLILPLVVYCCNKKLSSRSVS